MGEPLLDTWRRRAVTIPTMLVATVVATLAIPLLIPAAVAADLARGRWRFPTLRVYLFVLQYLINDSVEIVAAPALWIVGGFGTRLRSPASTARHERLMWWSATLLERRAEQLLGMRLDVDPSVERCLTDGPVIVISRHVSMFDPSLPGLLCHRAGFRVQTVILAELLADPGFDLLYRRLGSAFIPRDDAPRAVAAIRAMAAEASTSTALVIFPEGRLFTPDVRDRSLARLTENNPQRASQLSGLTHLLPPRPGGLLTLLDGSPDTDVVVLHHSGLDELRDLRDLLRRAPIGEPIRVTAERIERTAVPSTDAERIAWLDSLWCRLDQRRREADLSCDGGPAE